MVEEKDTEHKSSCASDSPMEAKYRVQLITRCKGKNICGSKLRVLPQVSGNKGIARYIFGTESELSLNAK